MTDYKYHYETTCLGLACHYTRCLYLKNYKQILLDYILQKLLIVYPKDRPADAKNRMVTKNLDHIWYSVMVITFPAQCYVVTACLDFPCYKMGLLMGLHNVMLSTNFNYIYECRYLRFPTKDEH